MLRPPPQQTVWQHPQHPQTVRRPQQTVRRPQQTVRRPQQTRQPQQPQQTRQPQQPQQTRQPQQPPQTVRQTSQKSKSLKYENYVIENINNININLQESVLIFNKENELLLDIENIKYIEDIKHTIKNLRENSLNNLSFVNSLDNFSVSIYTQNKIIKLQENLHFFLNKLRDILHIINTIEHDNHIDYVINETYRMIITHPSKDNKNIDYYIKEINSILRKYDFRFNYNKVRFDILNEFLAILNEFKVAQNKESQTKVEQTKEEQNKEEQNKEKQNKEKQIYNVVYMGGIKKPTKKPTKKPSKK